MHCELGVLAAAGQLRTTVLELQIECVRPLSLVRSRLTHFLVVHNEITTTAAGAKGYLYCLVNCVQNKRNRCSLLHGLFGW